MEGVFHRRIKNISDFHVNKEIYILGRQYNPHYFRTAYIDNNGFLKNSKFTKDKFGNIFDTSLSKLIENDSFKFLWNITKDDISVCKKCQFRYICNDNRIPIKNDEGTILHEETCAYDPFLNSWNKKS